MQHYSQLTSEQRYQIYALKKKEHTMTEIADVIGVHKSTVSRELRRNTGGRGYRPKQAHQLALLRRDEKVRFWHPREHLATRRAATARGLEPRAGLSVVTRLWRAISEPRVDLSVHLLGQELWRGSAYSLALQEAAPQTLWLL